jgi:hypothetical protein
MADIKNRLDQILAKIKSPDFMENTGQGGEIGFYIFDYDPRYELLVRSHVKHIIGQFTFPGSEINPVELDLYELMLEILDERVPLSRVDEMEEKQGSDRLFKTIKPMLKPENFISKIKEKVSGYNLVLITGVGKAWPFVRSHTVLNNLHAVLDEIPVIMFFPGVYDQRELTLFGKFKDDNYYRAFKLVE